LNLNECKVNDASAAALATSPHLQNLEKLYLGKLARTRGLRKATKAMLSQRFGDGVFDDPILGDL
jgi:hypothetical protein